MDVLELDRGWALLGVTGDRARTIFQHEAGGHRWQRVPPTERHGRVHTSTITVAVLDTTSTGTSTLREDDLDWQMTCGSGPGGQHRNRSQTAVRLKHRPTGLVVRVENERSQHQNRLVARAILEMKLRTQAERTAATQRNDARRAQIGSGQRGDKVRTIRQDGVVDHRTGRRWTYKDYVRGNW